MLNKNDYINLGGGLGHFFAYAPEPLKYPIDRYTMETKRQLDLLDKTSAAQII